MNDSLATRGFVATAPNHLVTTEGLPITTFRLAASRRRFNRQSKAWENSGTNWYTVTAFRQLALNVASCVSKGDPVIVSGRLSVREWENDERSGIVVEIDAETVGHDLGWGSAAFSRTIRSSALDGQDASRSLDASESSSSDWPGDVTAASDAEASPDARESTDGPGSGGTDGTSAPSAGARDAAGWALPATAESSPGAPF